MEKITTEQAYEMGTKGAPATEAERLLFEAWMRGHCWKLSCEWDGKQYTNLIERAGGICPHAIRTRQLWATWRDRAALAQPEPVEPDMFWNHDDAEKLYDSIDEFLNDEICNGTPLEVGETRTIQRAIRLPNIEIRITAIHDEECEADYEIVEAASKGGAL